MQGAPSLISVSDSLNEVSTRVLASPALPNYLISLCGPHQDSQGPALLRTKAGVRLRLFPVRGRQTIGAHVQHSHLVLPVAPRARGTNYVSPVSWHPQTLRRISVPTRISSRRHRSGRRSRLRGRPDVGISHLWYRPGVKHGACSTFYSMHRSDGRIK